MTEERSEGSRTEQPPRKSLLLLAYSFPPVNKISSVRTYNIARHLNRLGWRVTVVTPRDALCRDVEGRRAAWEEEGIRRLETGHRWRFLVPSHLVSRDRGIGWVAGGVGRRLARLFRVESEIGWTHEAIKACSRLRAGDVDLVMASGPPFISFRLARKLSESFNCPYVLDYRDLWTRNPHLRLAGPLTASREARLLEGAAVVTVTSPSIGESLHLRFGLQDRIQTVTNGFDPDSFAGIRPLCFGHFAILYAGRFYPPKRVITPLMAALKRLQNEAADSAPSWMFHYYGPHPSQVRDAARTFSLEDRVLIHDEVPRENALEAIKGAGVAVVITSVRDTGSIEDRGILTGKVYEAIGLGTPVLGICPVASDLEVILETTGLGRCFRGSQVGEIAEFLGDLMRSESRSRTAPDAYSWVQISGRLDRVLRKAMGRHQAVHRGQRVRH